MAKKRKKGRINRRDTNAITSNLLLSEIKIGQKSTLQAKLREGRRWLPSPPLGATLTPRIKQEYRKRKLIKPGEAPGRAWSASKRVSVAKVVSPYKAVICVRRAQRKEVLHALRRTGKGAGRKRPKKSIYSKVRCK